MSVSNRTEARIEKWLDLHSKWSNDLYQAESTLNASCYKIKALMAKKSPKELYKSPKDRLYSSLRERFCLGPKANRRKFVFERWFRRRWADSSKLVKGVLYERRMHLTRIKNIFRDKNRAQVAIRKLPPKIAWAEKMLRDICLSIGSDSDFYQKFSKRQLERFKP